MKKALLAPTTLAAGGCAGGTATAQHRGLRDGDKSDSWCKRDTALGEWTARNTLDDQSKRLV